MAQRQNAVLDDLLRPVRSGVSTLLFLLSAKKMRLLPAFDPFHRSWRDWQLAVQGCNLWSVVLETVIPLNLPHGPWLSESWFQQLQEGIVSYIGAAGPEDQMYQAVYEGICKDTHAAVRRPGVWHLRASGLRLAQLGHLPDVREEQAPGFHPTMDGVVAVHEGLHEQVALSCCCCHGWACRRGPTPTPPKCRCSTTTLASPGSSGSARGVTTQLADWSQISAPLTLREPVFLLECTCTLAFAVLGWRMAYQQPGANMRYVVGGIGSSRLGLSEATGRSSP